MKFIQKSLGQLSKVSASTPIKSAANGILGYMELENSNETEIYNLINENFSKYSTDKNVSVFLNAVKNYKKGKNLGISESLNKILASNKNIDGDLKFTVVDLQESLGTCSEGKMASQVLNRLKPFRWNMVTNEAIDTIEKSVKENGILSMLNDTIDALLEDEASNANAIATITQAYHLPETDIRHYLLSQFSGKAGIYPVVDDLLKTLVATGDNLDVETIKYNIDSTGRYSTSIPVSPVIQEGKRKLFMLKNRIFESLNGKIRLVESANRVPEKFLELCNAFTKVKFDESKKTMILESRNNTMAICEDAGGEGYQIQLNGSNLGSDMTTYESEIQGMGADLGIPQDDINSFVCLAGNFKSIAMLDGVVSVEVNDVVSLDIIKADGGIYLAVYNKASDEMNLVNSQDTSAVDAIENEYNVDVHEFLNEDDEENIDGTADAGVDGTADAGVDGGGAETDTNAALEVALKELEDQLEETSENLGKLDALEDDYKDDSINELIERMQNTKDQLQAEIEEIRVKLGGGGTTNEVAAKAMVDLESVISASVDGNDIEDSTFKNGETTSVNDAITITPVVEFIKTDDKIQIGGIFIRVDSTDENGDIESTLAGKFDNVVDGNMIPILDEIVEINFEGLAALQGKIDEIISKLEKDGDTPPTDDVPAEEPNESKLVLERKKKLIEAKSEKMYVITKERNGRETEFIGTVKKLTEDFSYTLLLAAEARVKGINQNPTTITQLISSLEKAYGYTEESSYNRTSLRWRENGKVETSESADGLEGMPSTTKGKTLIYKPVAKNSENQVAISKKFDEFVDYLKKNYKNGDEFSMNVNGDYVINNKVLLKDLELFKMANVITTDVENKPKSLNESNDSEGMLHYVLNQMSSGTIASYIDASDYKTVDKVRSCMIKKLQAQDQEYSIDNAKKLAQDCFSSINEGKTKFIYTLRDLAACNSKIAESKDDNEKTIGKIEILLKQNDVDGDTTNEIISALKNSETPNVAEILNGALRKTLADKIWNEIKNIDESKINESEYGLKVKFKYDKTTDMGVKIPKGTVVEIDVITDDPNTNFRLMPVRLDGKHIGYIESQHPYSEFDEVNEANKQDATYFDKLEKQITKEQDWLAKYANHIDKGTFPDKEFNDEKEFLDDVKRTENNLDRLKKQLSKKVGESKPHFINGDLSNDLSKLLDFDEKVMKKDEIEEDSEITYCIDVNDQSYFYANMDDRDKDFKTLNGIFKQNESKINESQVPLFVFSTAIGAWTTFFVDAISTDSQEISDKISDAYDEAPGTYKVYDTKEFDGYKFIWCECASANDYNIIVVTPDNSNNTETLQKIKTVLETNKNGLSAGSYFLDEAIGGEYVGNLHGLYESNGSEFNGFKILTGKEAEEKMTKLYNTGASTDSDDDKVFGIYSESPEKWIAFDNTSGEGNVELFASETEAMKWIKGEEAISLFIPESLDGGNSVSRSSFAQVWDELYSEDFAAEYSELYNKLPKSLSFGDFVILWNETYNEDFVKEYPRFSRKFTVCSEYPEFTAFVKELYEKYDLNFHPDDSFADYVGHDNQPTFTDAQAKEFDDKMDSFVETIDDDDLYDVIYQVQRELGIGIYQISEAKKDATDAVKTVKRGRKPDAINVKIRKQLAKGNTITEIAKSLGLKYQRVKNVKKRDDKKK